MTGLWCRTCEMVVLGSEMVESLSVSRFGMCPGCGVPWIDGMDVVTQKLPHGCLLVHEHTEVNDEGR